MFIRTIRVDRDGDYGYGRMDPSKPFRAVVQVEGQHGKIELNLSTDLSAKIMEVIADEIVAASKATAEAMTADILTVAALPSPQAA
jgi:hypothetical protein